MSTFYIRHKKTQKDVIVQNIDVSGGKVYVQNDEYETEEFRFVDVIEEYDFRYDIW